MPTSVRAAISSSTRERQRGFSLLFLVVAMGLVAATVFAMNLITRTIRGAGHVEVTKNNQARVSDSLVAYVTQNGRLPCPANPGARDGKADPEDPTVACNTPSGVVPWSTLGLPIEAAQDGWSRLISYRVFSGNKGLTQPSGASMVDCDIGLPFGPEDLLPSGVCRADHLNLEKQFLANKGLDVQHFAKVEKGIAFVLVSHGESGYGGYAQLGTRLQMPSSSNIAETANTTGVGPFQQQAHSDYKTEASAENHFDDILLWMRLEDLIRKSGLAGRDWPQEGAKISAATMTRMNETGSGHFNATTARGGETFSAATDQVVDTLSFGVGTTERFTNCAWWPTPFRIFSSEGSFTMRMYLEFAVADISRGGGAGNDFGGFVTGFLPFAYGSNVLTQISTNLCGNLDETNARDIGWDNSTLGNLPSPRFGLEFDPRMNPAYNDPPNNNHLALDLSGTQHGNTAPVCSNFANSCAYVNTNQPACYTSNGNTWLRDGLTRFHRLRVEIEGRSSDCSVDPNIPPGPKITTWMLPQSVCPDASTDAVCLSLRSLTASFNPTTLPAGAIKLSRCVPTPAPDYAFDRIYFGITASNGKESLSPALYLRNLAAGVF